MKLLLEIVSGPETGRAFAVELNRAVSFGRTDAADYSLSEDNYLSRRHFEVLFDADQGEWQVRDLESRHGTFVDGERIQQAALLAGQELRAGQSVFRTRLATEAEAAPEALAVAGAALVMFAATTASARPPAQSPDYNRSKCHTGLVTLIGADAATSPSSIAWMLSKRSKLYLIADFVKAAMPFPKQLERRDYLFNWADPEVLAAFSPVVIGPDDPVDPYEIIDALWGHDSVICIASGLEKSEILLRLRATVRNDDGKKTTTPKVLVGCCWPEAARPLFSTAPQRLISHLLNTDSAYLMEAEPPATWQIFVEKDHEAGVKKALQV